MTKPELLQLHQDTCAKALEIMRAKNTDYTAGTSDPFANFRASQIVGVDPIIGILSRSIDKFMRITSFVELGSLQVKDESVDDAFMDVINYMILGLGMIRESREGLTQAAPEVPQTS